MILFSFKTILTYITKKPDLHYTMYCLNRSGKTQASMDTIYGMLIHDIPGNAINHDIFPSKIHKGKKTYKNRSCDPFYPCILFKTLNLYN